MDSSSGKSNLIRLAICSGPGARRGSRRRTVVLAVGDQKPPSSQDLRRSRGGPPLGSGTGRRCRGGPSSAPGRPGSRRVPPRRGGSATRRTRGHPQRRRSRRLSHRPLEYPHGITRQQRRRTPHPWACYAAKLAFHVKVLRAHVDDQFLVEETNYQPECLGSPHHEVLRFLRRGRATDPFPSSRRVANARALRKPAESARGGQLCWMT